MTLAEIRSRLAQMQERVVADVGERRKQCLQDAETLEEAMEQLARLEDLEQ